MVKNPFQGVETIVEIEETPDIKRRKIKVKNYFSLLKK
jgi:hypothetical protein